MAAFGEKWDRRFLDMAEMVAGWSKDPSTKCGAVVVSSDRIVQGVGYNGFPRGVSDHEERYADRELKYKMVVHAEANAVANSEGSVRGSTVYVFPFLSCHDCAKQLIQRGVSRIVCPQNDDPALAKRWEESHRVTHLMCVEAGVSIDEVERTERDGW